MEDKKHNYVVITPTYKGYTSGDIHFALYNLEALAEQGHDVILVEDGSKDGSKEYIRKYLNEKKGQSKIHFLNLPRNSKKMGALYEGARHTNEILGRQVDYIICLDDDSKITNPETLDSVIQTLEKEKHLAGGCFRVETQDSKKLVVQIQDYMYLLSRSLHKFTGKKDMCTIAPGAGNIYRKTVFLEETKSRPDFFQGDDLWITTQVLKRKEEGKQRWGVRYFGDTKIQTKAPETYNNHRKQLTGWIEGDINVKFSKDGKFFLKNLKNRYGAISSLTYYGWPAFFVLPAIEVATMLQDYQGGYPVLDHAKEIGYTLASSYAVGLGITGTIAAYNRNEIKHNKNFIRNWLAFPIYFAAVGIPSKLGALGRKIKSGISKRL